MKYVLSFLLGALAGSLVALLFAPSSGEELRANIRTRADEEYTRLQDGLQKGMQDLRTRMDKMSSDMQALTNKAEETGTSAG